MYDVVSQERWGKAYDTVTGLYNYGYRDYEPQTARFTTVDPIRDGANWFSYVNNDPVNWVDLWGLSASDTKSKWTDNNNGTYTAKAGVTLYDLYGKDWQEKSGFTRDPITLQVGETVGIPTPTAGIPSPQTPSVPTPTAPYPVVPTPTVPNIPVNSSSDQQNNQDGRSNTIIGIGQMILGVGVVGIGGAIAIVSEGSLIQPAYAIAMAGVALFAFGFGRTFGGHDKPITNDLPYMIPEPIGTYNEIYKYLRK